MEVKKVKGGLQKTILVKKPIVRKATKECVVKFEPAEKAVKVSKFVKTVAVTFEAVKGCTCPFTRHCNCYFALQFLHWIKLCPTASKVRAQWRSRGAR